MLSDIDKALYSAESFEFKGGNGEGQTRRRITKVQALRQRLYLECLEKYMSGTQPSFVSLEAFVNAMVITEGLKQAGNNPTREKLIKALSDWAGVLARK